jgi:hypothetical protein
MSAYTALAAPTQFIEANGITRLVPTRADADTDLHLEPARSSAIVSRLRAFKSKQGLSVPVAASEAQVVPINCRAFAKSIISETDGCFSSE